MALHSHSIMRDESNRQPLPREKETGDWLRSTQRGTQRLLNQRAVLVTKCQVPTEAHHKSYRPFKNTVVAVLRVGCCPIIPFRQTAYGLLTDGLLMFSCVRHGSFYGKGSCFCRVDFVLLPASITSTISGSGRSV